MVVKPLYRGFMFLTGVSDNPDNNICTFTGRVCNQFTEMVMICIIQLILYDHFSVCSCFGCIDIHIEIAHRRFCFINSDINAYRIPKQVDILCDPRRKVQRLMRPYAP